MFSASEQMLYDVYEHTMGMIEELEKHEHAKYGKTAPNSGLLKHIIPRDAMQPEFEASFTCSMSYRKRPFNL